MNLVDEIRERLHRAGWSFGETVWGMTFQVDGSNGENRLLVQGSSQTETWEKAFTEARAMGMVAPQDEEP